MTTAVPKYSRRRKLDPVQPFLVILCILVCIITIYPMYYVLIMSISDPAEVSRGAVTILPKGFYLGSYETVFQDGKLWRAYGNTIFYAAASTLLMLLTTVLMAYAFLYRKQQYRTGYGPPCPAAGYLHFAEGLDVFGGLLEYSGRFRKRCSKCIF